MLQELVIGLWLLLVLHHLAMSNTAFKRDINDPKTISDFAALVQSPERLRLLLVLTVADIRGVGPNIWNNWKAALLRELTRRLPGNGHLLFGSRRFPEIGIARLAVTGAAEVLREIIGGLNAAGITCGRLAAWGSVAASVRATVELFE